MDLLAEHGVTREDIVAGRGGPGLRAVLGRIRQMARERLEKTRSLRTSIPERIIPAFLPLAFLPAYLDRMERKDYDPFQTIVDLPQWRKQWIVWRQAHRGFRL
jgi:phytoene synthase